MSEKGFYLDKPFELADRLERMGFYLDEEGAAVIRAQHVEIEALRVDAERYRYLRNRDPKEVLGVSGKAAGVWIDCEDDLSGLQLLTGDDADAAIDAARNKT